MTHTAHLIAVRFAQVVLGSIVVAATVSTVSGAQVAPVATASVPAPVVREAAQYKLEDFAAIEQRSIFRSSGEHHVAAALRATNLKLELFGTVVASGGNSLAVVRDMNGEVSTVREGESFGGGEVRLVSVAPRQIVIEYRGAQETVSLEQQQESPEVAQQRALEQQVRIAELDALDAQRDLPQQLAN